MENGDSYILQRDGGASVRLTAQHHILKTRQGYLLHPDIVRHIETIPEPRIADLACGNGIWAIDAANQFKNAQVFGMDLSSDQFPPKFTYLPLSSTSRLSFSQQDLLQPFPKQLLGTFDVVHCKHFVSTIPLIPDLTQLLRTFHSLLKPGGFLQWVEPTWPTAGKVSTEIVGNLRLEAQHKIANPTELPQAALIDITEREMQIATRMRFTSSFDSFLMSMPDLFEHANKHVPDIMPELLCIETAIWMANWEELLNSLEKKHSRESGIYKKFVGSYELDKKHVAEGGLLAYVMAIGIAKSRYG